MSGVSYPWHGEPKRRTECMKARATLRTNSLLSVQGGGGWGGGGVKAEPIKRFMCVYKGMSSEQVLSAT